MRRIIVSVVTAAMILIPASSAIANHNPDTPGCVTRGEFRLITKGTTQTQVTHIFETGGFLVAKDPGDSQYYPAQIRAYRACASGVTFPIVSFFKNDAGIWKVQYKEWY